MAAEFYYEISALPMLRFGESPGTSLEDFTALCEGQLPAAVTASLARVSMDPDGQPCCDTEQQWQAWETYVRNHVAKVRASRRSMDASASQRPDLDAFPSDRRRLDEILDDPDPLNRTRELDRLRWQHLDGLAVGHAFDLAALVLYKLKLLIALRWCALSAEEGRTRIQRWVTDGVTNAAAVRLSTDSSATT